MKTKKAKGTKKYVIKRKFKFEDYKNCLKATKLEKKKIKKKQKKIKLTQEVLEKIIKNS